MRRPQSCARLTAGPRFAFLLFLLFAVLAVSVSGSGQPAEGPTAETLREAAVEGQLVEQDVICPTEKQSDCYPRIFQATEVFQVVQEGQQIPQGLHVRLDVSTGRKEAKLNDPDEQNPALEGLAVDSAVVMVEPDERSPSGDVFSNNDAQIPKGAPAYEPVGKIKAPETESQAFYDSLTVLKTLSLADRPIDAALSVLKDISHDIYYGLKVAEDSNAVKELLCMMSSHDVFARNVDEEAVKLAGDAASVIGSALQNNQKALLEVERSWARISKATCTGTEQTLGQSVFSMLLPEVSGGREAAKSEGNQLSLTKVKTSALRGLIKSPAIRDDFLANGGMAQILRVLLLERPDLMSAQQKLANLVMDNFLDEGMGATLGVWPRPGDNDHDWDYQLRTLAKLHRTKKDHWSAELWKRLQDQRQTMRAAGGDGELEHTEL